MRLKGVSGDESKDYHGGLHHSVFRLGAAVGDPADVDYFSAFDRKLRTSGTEPERRTAGAEGAQRWRQKGGMMTHNIDTILVNPSEAEKVRTAFMANGLSKFADMIVPCIYAAKGQVLACNRERLMHLGVKIGDEEGV